MVEFVVATFAAYAAVDVVRRAPHLEEARLKWATTPGRVSRLMRCGWCLSHWAAALAVLLVYPAEVSLSAKGGPVLVLAVSGASRFVHDYVAGRRQVDPQTPPQTRKTKFYEAALAAATAAADGVLNDTPELAAVAVVLVWDVPGELPAGVVRTAPETGGVTDRTLDRLSASCGELTRVTTRQFMAAVGGEMQTLRQQLSELQPRTPTPPEEGSKHGEGQQVPG